jgi:hypothetical protein
MQHLALQPQLPAFGDRSGQERDLKARCGGGEPMTSQGIASRARILLRLSERALALGAATSPRSFLWYAYIVSERVKALHGYSQLVAQNCAVKWSQGCVDCVQGR